MSLDRLADIELQLCMHGMLTADRLRWARCSHQLMHAAQSPFAWKHVQPLQIKATRLSSASLLDIASPFEPTSSLLHLLSLHLHWTPDRAHVLPKSTLAGLEALARADAQVHSLDTASSGCVDVQPAILRALLSQPVMRHLRSLRLHSPLNSPSDDVLELLALHTPLLHTLHMPHSPYLESSAAHLPSLSRTLTSLHIGAQRNWSLPEGPLPFIAQCERLKHLSLVRPDGLIGAAFDRFFTSAHMRALQSIRIDTMNAAGLDRQGHKADYAAAFSALDQLHTLELLHVSAPDSLLLQLGLARSLRHLLLKCLGARR